MHKLVGLERDVRRDARAVEVPHEVSVACQCQREGGGRGVSKSISVFIHADASLTRPNVQHDAARTRSHQPLLQRPRVPIDSRAILHPHMRHELPAQRLWAQRHRRVTPHRPERGQERDRDRAREVEHKLDEVSEAHRYSVQLEGHGTIRIRSEAEKSRLDPLSECLSQTAGEDDSQRASLF